MELLLPDDVDLARIGAGADELVAEADGLREACRMRLRRDPRVGAAVDREPVVIEGDEVAAEPGCRLDDVNLAGLSGLLQGVRGREPRDAAADDDNPLHARSLCADA